MELKFFLSTVVVIVAIIHAGAASFDPCAPVCGEGTYNVPHPQDCTLYYVCQDGQASLQQCRDGLYFSPVYDECSHPIDARCTANSDYVCTGTPSTTTRPITTTTATTTGGVVNGTSGTTPEETTADVTNASEDPVTTTDEGFTTSEGPAETTTVSESPAATTEDARSTTQEPVVTTTPEEPASTTTEAATTAFRTTTPTEPATTTPTEPTTTTPIEPTTTTPVESTTTTPVEATTTTAAATTTEPAECIPECPSFNALYPDPKSCNSYFQCSNGVPIKMTCSPGLEFNPNLGVCDFPTNFECTSGPDVPCVAVTVAPRRASRV